MTIRSGELYEDSVRDAAMAYYYAYTKHDLAQHSFKQAQQAMKETQDEMLRHQATLEKSVQPICGSAHLPHMRVYLASANEVVIVYYFRDTDRGRIEVRKAL